MTGLDTELSDIARRARRVSPFDPLGLFKLTPLMWRFCRASFRESARQRRER